MGRTVKITVILGIVLMYPLSLFSADYCTKSIDKTIRCVQDSSVIKAMKKDRSEIIYHCRKDRYEIRRAKTCNKYRLCKNFMRCIRGD